MFGSLGPPELIVLALIAAGLGVVIWPAARICTRVGFSPWLGVLAVVPLANLVLLWFVAIAPWPAADQTRLAAQLDR
jgi:predicted PurR-regulated permease PerM